MANHLGQLLNQQGQVYGDIYDANISQQEKDILLYGEDGTLQRDVWHQVSFMTKEDYEAMKKSGFAS